MKKLFISQPMRGKTDEEILAVRAQAIQSAERVMGEKVEVIDSFIKGAPAAARPLWFLGESLKLLSGADVAYFAEGWEEARGCRIEHECAVEYGITTIEDYRQATMADAKREIAEMPAADVAPVVHCKDCEYSWEDIGGLTCSHGRCVDCIVPEDFFCADGVKREAADD